MRAKNKALAIAGAAADKKALDTVILNMRKVSGVCDYFVITSGASTTQTKAIADHILRALRARGERALHTEGEREASWILLDYNDVVVHVFLDQTRRFYSLERLWGDAPQERFKEAEPVKRRARKSRTKKKR